MYITNIKKVNNVRQSQVAYVTMVGNETLRPLGVAMGNAVSVTRVWSIHTKTQLVGWWLVTWLVTAYDVTTARPHYKRVPGEYIIHRGRSLKFPWRGTESLQSFVRESLAFALYVSDSLKSRSLWNRSTLLLFSKPSWKSLLEYFNMAFRSHQCKNKGPKTVKRTEQHSGKHWTMYCSSLFFDLYLLAFPLLQVETNFK